MIALLVVYCGLHSWLRFDRPLGLCPHAPSNPATCVYHYHVFVCVCIPMCAFVCGRSHIFNKPAMNNEDIKVRVQTVVSLHHEGCGEVKISACLSGQ